MADFGNVHNVEKFKRDGEALLRQVISNFFSAEVELFYYPTNELLQRYGVNIQQSPLHKCKRRTIRREREFEILNNRNVWNQFI